MNKRIIALAAAALAIALSATGFAGFADTANAASGQSAAQCLPQSAVTYVYDTATSTARVTVVAPKGMTASNLCHPIYLRAATFQYLLPTTGKTPSYPQKYLDSTYLKVAGVGSFELTAAAGSGTCEQHDFYASYSDHHLDVPAVLTAPHSPYEPTFLSELLGGRGPATYDADSSLGCESAVIPPTTPPVTLVVADPYATGQTCSTGGAGSVSGGITVDLGTAGGEGPGGKVEYSITTPSNTVLARVGKTTAVAPGVYVVNARAASGFTLPQSRWQLTVSPSSTVCPTVLKPTVGAQVISPTRATPLAATGVSNTTAGYLGLAGVLVLLGSGALVLARRRSHN